jgi:hypothetical protein
MLKPSVFIFIKKSILIKILFWHEEQCPWNGLKKKIRKRINIPANRNITVSKQKK